MKNTVVRIAHQLTQNTKLLQKVAIWHQDKVLILKRAKNSVSRPRMWDLAGGNSEWPTNKQSGAGLHKADAAREVKEETGIEVKAEKFKSEALVFFDTFFDAQKQIFTVICGWKLRLAENFDKNSVQISNEHTEAKWIKINELNKYNFGGKKGEFIKSIIKQSLF